MDEQRFRSIAVPRPIPIILSIVAGYVDGCTYLGLFGAFVAQLTGSFVLAGTQFIKSEPGVFAKLLAIPFFFFAGVAVTILAHSMRERPRTALAWSLAVECILLIGFLASSLASMPFRSSDAPGAVIALMFGMTAMGAQSAMVRLLMRGMPSTNVMTTNTTMLAINTAEILLGSIERWKVGVRAGLNADYMGARSELAVLLPIELGFLGGTALGAVAYFTVGLSCVLLAVLSIGGLAWYARHL
jgi:uncharacterized membrane protein YoaK (UPF0700 family)